MLKYAKVIDEETKECIVGTGTSSEFYKSLGMTEQEVEQAYTGAWYLLGQGPVKSIEEQNEKIRETRESLYQTISDPLKMDYDEAFARGEACEEAKQAWLDSKDKIRQDNPYIVVEPVDSAEKTVEPVESLNATVEVK